MQRKLQFTLFANSLSIKMRLLRFMFLEWFSFQRILFCRRLTKENVKQTGRQMGKLSHSNPAILFECVRKLCIHYTYTSLQSHLIIANVQKPFSDLLVPLGDTWCSFFLDFVANTKIR